MAAEPKQHQQQQWIRDLNTEQAEVCFRTMTLAQYLTSLHIYDPKTKAITFDAPSIALDIQRAPLRLQTNPIKLRMLQNVLCGSVLAPLMLQEDDQGKITVIDGLQRSEVLSVALSTAQLHHEGHADDIPKFIRDTIGPIESKILEPKELLLRPVYAQVWRGLSPSESCRLFLVANVAQQRVSVRHLTEALAQSQLTPLFSDWGLHTSTEKAEKSAPPGRKGKRPEIVFKLEFLVNCVRAYTSRDYKVRSKAALESLYSGTDSHALVEVGSTLEKNLLEFGSDISRGDFRWLFRDVAGEIARVYADVPKYKDIVSTSDNIAFPVIASISSAREHHTLEQVAERQATLLAALREADPGADPLRFTTPSDASLDATLSGVRANQLARTMRNIVYAALREWWRIGPTAGDCLIDWRGASELVRDMAQRG